MFDRNANRMLLQWCGWWVDSFSNEIRKGEREKREREREREREKSEFYFGQSTRTHEKSWTRRKTKISGENNQEGETHLVCLLNLLIGKWKIKSFVKPKLLLLQNCEINDWVDEKMNEENKWWNGDTWQRWNFQFNLIVAGKIVIFCCCCCCCSCCWCCFCFSISIGSYFVD